MLTSTNDDVVYTPVRTNRRSKSKQVSKLSLVLLAIIASFFLVTTITLAIFYAMELHSKNFNQTQQVIANNNSDLCLNRYCIQASHHLQENMDESVDPCENFYEFSCGSWMKNTKIPSDGDYESPTRKLRAEINSAIANLLSSSPPNGTIEPKAITNARRLYNSCVDEYTIEVENLDMISSLIDEEFGGWPSYSSSTWDASTFDLSYALLKSNQYNNFPFYYVATTIDYNSSETLRYCIRISPTQLRTDQDSYFIDENQFTKSHQRFKRDTPLMFVNQQSTTNTPYNPLTEFQEDISQYLLTSIVEYSSADIVTTVGNLSKTINTNFDFSDYIRRLYLLGNVTLTDDDIVVVNKIDAIRSISSIIAQQSPETLQRYIIVHFLKSQSFHLPKIFRTISENQKGTTSGVLDAEPRTIGCARYVNKNMEFAVSKLYIDKYYDKLARDESIEMVDNIRNAFIDMVNQSMWMDTVSKKNTIEKAQAIVAKVGYPEYLDNKQVTKLESIYAKYVFNSSHMQNVLLLLQLNAKKNFRRYREPINREEWIEHGPTTVNAFYRTLFNDITVPAGILRPPVFHKDAPKFLNYGAIGSIVGHEITHGFDELRRHLDKNGKIYTLWSQKTNDMYDKRSQCIVEQYNNYTVPQIFRQIDGDETREENIADNDGLKKAFYAYQKWVQTHNNVEKKLPGFTNYSAEQMFFISFGQLWCSKMTYEYALVQNLFDDHAPHQFRSIGPTSNFAEFDRVFGCKPGQGNSRVNKCSVW